MACSHSPDKPTPVASRPGNWCSFNERDVDPWALSRDEAAATLWRARRFRRTGQMTVRIEHPGRYQISGLDSMLLDTKHL